MRATFSNPYPAAVALAGPIYTPTPRSTRQGNTNDGSWSLTDGLVFLFAAAVLVLSILGFMFLIRN